MPDAPSSGGGAAEATPTGGPEQGQGQAPDQTPTAHETAEREGTGGEGLPGVLSTQEQAPEDVELAKALGFGEEQAGEEDGDPDSKPKTKGRERPRGPDGRFLKSEGEEAGQAEGEKPAVAPGSESDQTPAEKFQFAGEEWDSQEKAEQNFRTLRGMHKATEGRANENWNAYVAWKDYGEGQAQENAQLRARIAELEAGKGQQGSGDGQAGKADINDVKNVVDWDAYRYVLEKGSPEQAGQFMLEQALAYINEKVLPARLEAIEKKVDERLRPAEQRNEQAQLADTMTQVTTQMAGYKLPDGRDAFPELKDGTTVEEIGMLWAREARDQADWDQRLRMLTTPAGLMQAIANYRLIKSFQEPPATTVTEAQTPELPEEPVAPGAAATAGASGREGFVPGPSMNLPPGEAAMVAELDKGTLVDEDLGFARNPSARRR